ncbi:hypothetical protein C8R46DRAFT_436827 [Mycena filopes]|nr:hypothetical protein C8R46DRAFT_436827 [Mycena filopes]
MLGHLAADRARVAELDAQILQLQDRIRNLELHKLLIQDRLDAYCYPVLVLPNEITAEIFVHFLPVFPHRPPLTGIASPTLLTQICRAWREIALSTPTLWKAISFMDLDIPFASGVDMAELWLSRSGSCPLSIEIFSPGNDLSGLLSRIFQEAGRLEELKLFISAPYLPVALRSMPLLTHVDLFLEDLPPEADIVLFRDTPALRSAVLNDAALGIQLPWAQLTSVLLHAMYPNECVPVLRQTTNLLHFELMIVDDGGPRTDFTLPFLESLTLKDSEAPMVGYLDTLTLPALRSLSIPESFLGEDPIDALTRFITKSDCKLQELCITNMYGVQNPGMYRLAFPLIPKLALDDGYATTSSESDES